MQLDLVELRLAYGEHAVVRGLSLSLFDGHIGCLLGPSGSGKTSVLRAIAGFEPALGGRIVADGAVLSAPGVMVPPEARQIGMVFQDYALFPHLTVLDNVTFGLHRLAVAERVKRAREVLDTVGLSGRARCYPHELSGGEQQRVALCRALAPQPRLLLLDEPFSNLDVDLRRRLSEEVRQILKHYEATALMVTHDQREAFAIADEIGILNEGVIEQWDSAYALYHRPASRFVAEFVGQGVFLPGIVGDDGRVSIELGQLAGENTQRHPPGTRLDVLLRPDDIVHDDQSQLLAKVSKKAFRGAEILYTLSLKSGATVLALVPSHHDHRVGESIGIRLEAEHVVAFEAT